MVTLLSMIVLGFFLGMRHATDPDHVVAVSTIVSCQRNLKHAAMIGVLWGFGHTIRILVVGSAIILFNFVIPPRIGLSMELSVGLMLILLGVLNLSGIMQWVTKTCMRSQSGVEAHRHVTGLARTAIHNPPARGLRQRVGRVEFTANWVCIKSSAHWRWESFMVSPGP